MWLRYSNKLPLAGAMRENGAEATPAGLPFEAQRALVAALMEAAGAATIGMGEAAAEADGQPTPRVDPAADERVEPEPVPVPRTEKRGWWPFGAKR